MEWIDGGKRRCAAYGRFYTALGLGKGVVLPILAYVCHQSETDDGETTWASLRRQSAGR